MSTLPDRMGGSATDGGPQPGRPFGGSGGDGGGCGRAK